MVDARALARAFLADSKSDVQGSYCTTIALFEWGRKGAIVLLNIYSQGKPGIVLRQKSDRFLSCLTNSDKIDSQIMLAPLKIKYLPIYP